MRIGNWKLIEFYHWDKIELYNLQNDPGEQTELSETHPDKARALQAELHSWQERMKARMPVPLGDT